MFLEVKKDDTVSSLDLLKEINYWRGKESEHTENIRADLQHKDLLRVIRDEFEEEISQRKISPSEYISDRGRKYPMFNLTLNQSKQVLLRESRFVRKAIIRYIEQLEAILKEKKSTEWLQDRKNGKLTRRRETDVIQEKLIPLAISQGSSNHKMFYSNYSVLVNKTVGLEKGMRNNCTRETLNYLNFLESAIESTIEKECAKNTYYKDIYQICKAKCETLKTVLEPPIQKYLSVEEDSPERYAIESK